MHSSLSEAPSARRRHDWHYDYHVNRPGLLGGSLAGSMSDAGSLDFPISRNEEDPLRVAGNPRYHMSMQNHNGQNIRLATTQPLRAIQPAAADANSSRKSYTEWTNGVSPPNVGSVVT